ncbi:MAG: hypothetical protein H6920_08195 [Sphingomonadaceae bacterium]|nr:hypothetical protein [Sphingomonadaceae bacterium]MCP5394549.1 hypothetical protein [Sphingomonadaceae bacterium]
MFHLFHLLGRNALKQRSVWAKWTGKPDNNLLRFLLRYRLPQKYGAVAEELKPGIPSMTSLRRALRALPRCLPSSSRPLSWRRGLKGVRMDFGRTMRGGIIALVAGAVLVGCTPPTPEQARKQIERDIIEGEGAPVFRAARKHFPQDYEALLQELTAASQSSEGRNPLKATALGERITINWMEQLTDKLIPLVAEAPLDPLLAMQAAQSETLEHLQATDVRHCAQMAMGETIEVADEGAEINDLLIRQNAAMITAAGASQRDPQQWAEPTEQEHNALFDGMLRHGASERLLGILADNAELARASDKDKCDIGVSINATVNDMPPELAARFVAMWHRPL